MLLYEYLFIYRYLFYDHLSCAILQKEQEMILLYLPIIIYKTNMENFHYIFFSPGKNDHESDSLKSKVLED